MRVGINALSLVDGGGGTTRYGAELIGALVEHHPDLRLRVFVSRGAASALTSAPWTGEVAWTRVPADAGSKANAVMQVGGLLAPALARRCRVLHSLAGTGPPHVPGLATVVTVLDLIWLRLPDQVAMSDEERAGWERITRFSVARSSRVLAISEHTRRDVIDVYGVDPARVDVTPLAARPVARAETGDVRSRLGLGAGRIVLSVGQQQPYKAQDQLIRALPELDPDVELVLPGAPTGFGDSLRRLAADLGVAERVHLLGFTAEADLEALYAAATCVAQPSRMEGFGLPALEAMVRGVPLACSGATALAEVVGDAALLFDPGDTTTVTTALRALLADPALRERLAAQGRVQAARFTWRATADATVAAYHRTL